jgi:hypothetical protein
MQIELDENAVAQIRSVTTLKLEGHDFDYFADWLILVGVQTVKTTLKERPDLTLGDLVIMQYRFNYH